MGHRIQHGYAKLRSIPENGGRVSVAASPA